MVSHVDSPSAFERDFTCEAVTCLLGPALCLPTSSASSETRRSADEGEGTGIMLKPSPLCEDDHISVHDCTNHVINIHPSVSTSSPHLSSAENEGEKSVDSQGIFPSITPLDWSSSTAPVAGNTSNQDCPSPLVGHSSPAMIEPSHEGSHLPVTHQIMPGIGRRQLFARSSSHSTDSISLEDDSSDSCLSVDDSPLSHSPEKRFGNPASAALSSECHNKSTAFTLQGDCWRDTSGHVLEKASTRTKEHQNDGCVGSEVVNKGVIPRPFSSEWTVSCSEATSVPSPRQWSSTSPTALKTSIHSSGTSEGAVHSAPSDSEPCGSPDGSLFVSLPPSQADEAEDGRKWLDGLEKLRSGSSKEVYKRERLRVVDELIRRAATYPKVSGIYFDKHQVCFRGDHRRLC